MKPKFDRAAVFAEVENCHKRFENYTPDQRRRLGILARSMSQAAPATPKPVSTYEKWNFPIGGLNCSIEIAGAGKLRLADMDALTEWVAMFRKAIEIREKADAKPPVDDWAI